MGRKSIMKVFGLLMVAAFLFGIVQPAYTSNEGKMRVWVEFKPGQAQQTEQFLNGAGAEFHYRFEELNSFVVTLPENALNGLRHNPNIISIEEDAPRYAYGETVPYGIDKVQARQIWDKDGNLTVDVGAVTGADRTVCIIDSGLYTEHDDFVGVNILGGYPSNWNSDTCGHGSHVAGTITANQNGVGVVGVNPGGVNLYIVKVFGDNCDWTYSSTLVDAANRCSAAGANVISMSLGGTQKSKTEERAFATLYSNGILSIAAAGNDGNTSISYPGGYTSVMSVAAIDSNNMVADFSQKNSTVEIAAPGVGVLSTIPYIETNTVTVAGTNYSANHVEFSSYGDIAAPLADGGLCSTETSSLAGSIALCERGDVSFLEKVNNANNRGAVAVLIYNNLPGNDLFTLGEEISYSIIALSLSQEDGQYLVANQLGQTASLHSDIQWDVSGYEAWDGTSMATPHVSGVAALIWSANPAWTNVQIRDALTSTALDLGEPGRDVEYGFGLVQAYDALELLGGGVEPPLDMPMYATVDTDKDAYSDRQTVVITVTAVDDNQAAVAGANVAIRMTTATGSTVSLSAVTNSSGVASISYRISTRRTGKGTYSIEATVTKDGYLPATANTSFLVN